MTRYVVRLRHDDQVAIRSGNERDDETWKLNDAFELASELAGWGPPMRIYKNEEKSS